MEKPNVAKIFDSINDIVQFDIYLNDIISPLKPLSSKFGSLASVNIYFSDKVIVFKKSLYKQLIIKLDLNLLKLLIKESRKEYKESMLKLDKFREIPNTVFDEKIKHDYQEEEYKFALRILGGQKHAILEIIKILEETLKFIEYTSVEDYSRMLNDLENEKNIEMDTSINNKATFNLSKTDSLMFIYMLEKCNLINFESTSHRNSFIENNFNYSDLRNIQSENRVQPMKGVSVDLANIKSNDKPSLKRFNKNLESLKDKLQAIMDFKLES